jgi:membrane-associated protease RseP (regulator of RpoE activity)
MNYTAYTVGLILLGIAVHELGHYVAFRAFGLKPNIRFRLWGISIGENVVFQMTLLQHHIMLITGILAGAPFFAAAGREAVFIYFGISILDILNLFIFMPKAARNPHRLFADEYQRMILADLRKTQEVMHRARLRDAAHQQGDA